MTTVKIGACDPDDNRRRSDALQISEQNDGIEFEKLHSINSN